MTIAQAEPFISQLLEAVTEFRVRAAEINGRVWGAINHSGVQALNLTYLSAVGEGSMWIADIPLIIVDDRSAEPAAVLLCLRPQAWGIPVNESAD